MNHYLNQLEMFGIKLGLDQMTELLERLGRPDRKYKIIHVAGTNGKGSVCAMIERALRHAGFKTGLYTSPHLVKVNERFKLNGQDIRDDQLERAIHTLKPHADAMIEAGNTPTYFEFTTALALNWFAQKNCDVVILETGMGGRLDATNVVTPICCAITKIGLDHQGHLGDTLTDIAHEKAGIIKPNIPVISAPQTPEAQKVLTEVAESLHASICVADNANAAESLSMNNGHQEVHLYGRFYELSLAGVCQRENAAVAYKVLETLSHQLNFNFKKSLSAWNDVAWPGRFQLLNWNTIIDGAHNPDGANALVKAWKYRFGNEKATILFANFADKSTAEILEILLPIAQKFIFVPIEGAKNRASLAPEKLTKLVHTFNPDLHTVECHTLETAIKNLETHEGYHLICGSLFLVGDYFKYKK